jgi:hypothetical protein
MLSSTHQVNDSNSCNIYYQTIFNSTFSKKVLKYKNKNIKNKCIIIIKDHYIELYEIFNNTKLLLRHSKNIFGTIYDAEILQSKVKNSCNEVEYKDIIIVLSDSGYLSLLEYTVNNNESNFFIHDLLNEEKKINLNIINQFKISNFGFDYRNPTFFIRTDPLSRSICISSFINNINIWNVNSEISNFAFNMDNSLMLNENGTIIDLAYLYPFQDDLNKINLVALTCSDMKVYIVVYNFDNSDNLKCKNNFKSIPFLDAKISMPIQLIALPQFPECFLVLTEQDIYFFKLNILIEQNIYCSKINLTQYILNNDILVTSVTSYDDFPEFRTKDMKLPEYQNLLLGTSNGVLFKLSVYSNNELSIKNITNNISILHPIYIDYYEGSDYFFSPGEMCDGYLFSINKRTNELSIHDKIIDLSLLTDCVYLESQIQNSNTNYSKLFVACGYQPNGSVKSIENGIRATMLTPKLLIEGIIDLWTTKCEEKQFIIISFYNKTLILGSQEDQTKKYITFVNCNNIINFDIDCKTIYSDTILNNSYLLQITEKSINFVYCGSDSDNLKKYEIVNEWKPSNNKKLLKAEIEANYILLKYSDAKTIEIIKVDDNNPYLSFEEIKEIYSESEISSMKLILKNNV